MVFGFMGYGGGTVDDASPDDVRIAMVSIVLYGAGMAIWPFLASFRPAVDAWYRQTHLGEPPAWLGQVVPPFMCPAVPSLRSWP
jgi:hypothetical protein